MRRMHTLMGVALLAVLVSPAAGGSFDRLLPESTVVYASVEDVSGLSARMKASPLNELWSEESVQDFLELPRQKWAEMMKEAASEIGGARPDELMAMLKGQVAFAFTGMRKAEAGRNVIGFVLLADVGENAARVKEWFGRVESSESWAEKHRRVESEFRGTPIVTWVEIADDEEGVEEGDEETYEPGPPCYFVSGSHLAFASDPKVLEEILHRRDAEDARSLADGAIYGTVRRRTGLSADVVFFVNLEEVWKMTLATAGKDNPMVGTVLDALGLTGVKGFGGRMSLEAQGTTSHFFVHAPGEKTGVMKMMGGANTALVPPKFVPTGVASAMTMAFDWQDLWAEARKVMDKIQPGMTESVDSAFESMKEQLGIDMEADVIGSLGKHITFYQIAEEPDADADEGMFSVGRMVLALEITDAEKLNGAFDALLPMVPVPFENRDYLGVNMRVMSGGMFEMGIATVAGHLILATNLEDLQAIIQTQGKDFTGLADTEAFKRALAGLPGNRSMVSYSDPRQAMGALSKMMEQMGPFLLMQNPEMADWIDFSLFPDAETLSKYMDLGGSVMLSEEDGISMIGISRMKSAR